MKHILITAGPTREMIDPVRFLSNLSTGEMGYRIAEAAAKKGHRVTLLSSIAGVKPIRGVKVVPFQSTQDLQSKLIQAFKKTDVLFMTAAVSDYTPSRSAIQKMKRQGHLVLKLKGTPDLLKGLIPYKKKQTVVGFCLETANLGNRSKKKLETKKLDYIVGNLLSPKTNPFGSGKTSVLVLDSRGKSVWLRNKNKKFIADFLIKKICSV